MELKDLRVKLKAFGCTSRIRTNKLGSFLKVFMGTEEVTAMIITREQYARFSPVFSLLQEAKKEGVFYEGRKIIV